MINRVLHEFSNLMDIQMIKEIEMYGPIKDFFRSLGYEVKAEIHNCDVVAHKSQETPIIIELKTQLSLDLIIQGVQRLSISDRVYIAVATHEKKSNNSLWNRKQKHVINLCRRLGLGLLDVNIRSERVAVLADPGPYFPKKENRHTKKLLLEFSNRLGDPNQAGSSRTKIITAYRQDSILCAIVLAELGEASIRKILNSTGVEKTASILQNNFYGWFKRTKRGVYTLTPAGRKGLKSFKNTVNTVKYLVKDQTIYKNTRNQQQP